MVTHLILAALAAPLTWQQIDLHQKLILNTPLVLSEKLTLATDTQMKVTDILPLDEIRVLSFALKVTPCTQALKNQSSEMVIVNELYGAKLEKNCKLEMFLELRDLNQESLFSPIESKP